MMTPQIARMIQETVDEYTDTATFYVLWADELRAVVLDYRYPNPDNLRDWLLYLATERDSQEE